MNRGFGLVVLNAVLVGVVIVTTSGAQPPSLVLADGGLEFPDGSVQTTAAPAILIGPVLVPVTGQTTCYDAAGAVIDCATDIGPGQDGEQQAGVRWPNPRFTDNGDGTVTDNLTGLIWLRDASCAALAGTDASGQGSWTTALSAAAALADGTCGLSDGSEAGNWRLPNLFELDSLRDMEFYAPALSNGMGTAQWSEGNIFSGVESSSYWSSTTIADFTTGAWSVSFLYGDFGYDSKDDAHYVWPVRGGGGAQVYPVGLDDQQPQGAAPTLPSLVLADGGLEFPDGSVQTTAARAILIGPALVPVTGQTTCYDAAGAVIDCATDIGPGQDGEQQAGVRWPNPRFTDNGDGTVTDNLTGLIWLRDASCAALAGTDASGQGSWTTALSAAAALADGTCGLSDGSEAGNWRLPNLFELDSLRDMEFYAPALSNGTGTAQWSEGNIFSGVESSSYWSSTTPADFTTGAWAVSLSYGNPGRVSRANNRYVWPVRGGQ